FCGLLFDRAEALEAVDYVLGRQLPAVDGRLGMPPHALAQLEEIRGLVRLRPRFREIALQEEGSGLHSRPRSMLQETAVGEAVHDLGLEGDDEVRVEVRRIPHSNGEDAATLGSLGERDRRRGYCCGRAGHR